MPPDMQLLLMIEKVLFFSLERVRMKKYWSMIRHLKDVCARSKEPLMFTLFTEKTVANH